MLADVRRKDGQVMSTVGQIEKRTQQRVVKLFRDSSATTISATGPTARATATSKRNCLRTFLREKQGYDEALITRALYLLDKAAGDTSKSLYDRNRAVYDLLRYGVKVKADVGREHADRLADRLEAPGEQPLRHRRGSHRRWPPTPRPTQAPGRRALRQRHRARRAGAEALHGLGGRGHPPEPRQPEEGVHPALLLDHAVGHGGQRHRGPALRHHRDAGEVLPDLEGRRAPSRTRSTGR